MLGLKLNHVSKRGHMTLILDIVTDRQAYLNNAKSLSSTLAYSFIFVLVLLHYNDVVLSVMYFFNFECFIWYDN